LWLGEAAITNGEKEIIVFAAVVESTSML